MRVGLYKIDQFVNAISSDSDQKMLWVHNARIDREDVSVLSVVDYGKAGLGTTRESIHQALLKDISASACQPELSMLMNMILLHLERPTPAATALSLWALKQTYLQSSARITSATEDVFKIPFKALSDGTKHHGIYEPDDAIDSFCKDILLTKSSIDAFGGRFENDHPLQIAFEDLYDDPFMLSDWQAFIKASMNLRRVSPDEVINELHEHYDPDTPFFEIVAAEDSIGSVRHFVFKWFSPSNLTLRPITMGLADDKLKVLHHAWFMCLRRQLEWASHVLYSDISQSMQSDTQLMSHVVCRKLSEALWDPISKISHQYQLLTEAFSTTRKIINYGGYMEIPNVRRSFSHNVNKMLIEKRLEMGGERGHLPFVIAEEVLDIEKVESMGLPIIH